jgi:hypothetical protein
MFTDKYSKSPIESTIIEIKNIIVNKAVDINKEYSNGRAPIGYDMLA